MVHGSCNQLSVQQQRRLSLRASQTQCSTPLQERIVQASNVTLKSDVTQPGLMHRGRTRVVFRVHYLSYHASSVMLHLCMVHRNGMRCRECASKRAARATRRGTSKTRGIRPRQNPSVQSHCWPLPTTCMQRVSRTKCAALKGASKCSSMAGATRTTLQPTQQRPCGRRSPRRR